MKEKYKVCFTKITEKPRLFMDDVFEIDGKYYKVNTRGHIIFSDKLEFDTLRNYSQSIPATTIKFLEETVHKCKPEVSKVSIELTVE